jgi:hypothetical protein
MFSVNFGTRGIWKLTGAWMRSRLLGLALLSTTKPSVGSTSTSISLAFP